jgi:hypothetical protein
MKQCKNPKFYLTKQEKYYSLGGKAISNYSINIPKEKQDDMKQQAMIITFVNKKSFIKL